MEELSVKLEVFEGPMDLLLHLIGKNKIDIYDIPIASITTQYMESIRSAEYDMGNMSEFIKMSATLLEIKARMLLPKPTLFQEEEEDPRKELVEKLLEYKLFKFISEELRAKSVVGNEVFFSQAHIPVELSGYIPKADPICLLDEVTLSRLQDIFQGIMSRQADKKDPVRQHFGRIEKDEVTVEEQMDFFMKRIEERGRIEFIGLFDRNSSRIRMIVSFLALLELIKLNKISVEQNGLFSEIFISKK